MASNPLWSITEAENFIRSTLEPFLSKNGFHCALTGSVLYKGFSYKDLDIIIYPHGNGCSSSEVDEILVMLDEELDIEIKTSPYHSYNFNKRVFICEDQNNRRIDLFFFGVVG